MEALILFTIFILMVLFVPNNNKKALGETWLHKRKLDKLTDEEIKEKFENAWKDEIWKRYNRYLSYGMDYKEDRDRDLSKGEYEPSKLYIWHGGCLQCIVPERYGNKECLTCELFPGNWNRFDSKSERR